LATLLRAPPAVLVTGPQAAGKTTLARRLSSEVLSLDDPAVGDAVAANPDAALRRASEPVLLDEWQEVPAVLGAVKRAYEVRPLYGGPTSAAGPLRSAPVGADLGGRSVTRSG